MDVKYLTLFILQINLLIYENQSARILAVYSAPFLSHQVVFRSLTLELVKRGHELVVITTFPIKTGNFTEIDVGDIAIAQCKDFLDTVSSEPMDLNMQKLELLKTITKIGLSELLHPEVQKLLNSGDHFDLIIMETGIKINYIFAHIFKAPVIMISSLTASLDDYELFGAPTHPFLYPPSMPKRIYNLSLWEKIVELYGYLLFKYAYIKQEEYDNALLKQHFGDNIPKIEELKEYTVMLFLNVHRIWEGNRPVPPNIIYLGGLHLTPERELSKELKLYLDSSKNGVIYMSFGSAVKSSLFPQEKLEIFLQVFRSLPYDILWKWEGDEISVSKNIKLMKWLPQSDLLRHPKIKLFITQGGLQSTDEAIIAGVPLVGIPMFADQWYSAEKYVHHGIGTKLDFNTLDEEGLRKAIESVLKNKSYYENIVKLRELMYDQPDTSLERAVWWTEHVLRHGGARHLRPPAANMPWTEYYEIQLVAYLLLAFVSVLVVCVLLIYFILKYIIKSLSGDEKLKRN